MTSFTNDPLSAALIFKVIQTHAKITIKNFLYLPEGVAIDEILYAVHFLKLEQVAHDTHNRKVIKNEIFYLSNPFAKERCILCVYSITQKNHAVMY